MATLATSTDGGLTRFMTAVTFGARVSVLNAGLMGVFNWNLMDLLLPPDAHATTSAASQTICLVCGVLGVIVLCMLTRRHEPQSAVPALRVSVPSAKPRLSRPEFTPAAANWPAVQPMLAQPNLSAREAALNPTATGAHLACTITEFSS